MTTDTATVYRARTPLDNLDSREAFVSLPVPSIAVGTKVKMREWARKQDLAYYWRNAVRQVISDTRAVVTVLQRDGYLTGMVGRKMLAHNKAKIRAALDIMRTADSVEVAGHMPSATHVVGSVAGQCYLTRSNCHGGVEYHCYLLFRKKDSEGRELAYIHRHAMVSEGSLEALPAAA